MKYFFVLLGCLMLFSACSTKTPYASLHKYKKNQKTHFKKSQSILDTLYQEYNKWKGVRYCYGGASKNGVDCSALVQIIYKEAFHIKIPRTTQQQAKIGYRVEKYKAKAGDIVLFKTGYKTKHSGIYLEKGDFLHASTKYGVVISNINNPYWRSVYWQTRRVLPH